MTVSNHYEMVHRATSEAKGTDASVGGVSTGVSGGTDARGDLTSE